MVESKLFSEFKYGRIHFSFTGLCLGDSLLIQQHNRFCRFCLLCPGDSNTPKHYWKVIVKLLGPSPQNFLPCL